MAIDPRLITVTVSVDELPPSPFPSGSKLALTPLGWRFIQRV
jgi:hypothetical protein